MLSRFSRVQLFATPGTCIAYQAPLSVGFSRQEYWRGLQCPSFTPSPRQPLNLELLSPSPVSLLKVFKHRCVGSKFNLTVFSLLDQQLYWHFIIVQGPQFLTSRFVEQLSCFSFLKKMSLKLHKNMFIIEYSREMKK